MGLDLRPEERERLIAWRTRQIPEFCRASKAYLGFALDQEFERLEGYSDPAFCERGCAKMQIPGTTPAMFGERVLRWGDGACALAGIRFRGLDPKQPFVSLWPDRDLDPSSTDPRQLSSVILEAFGALRPRGYVFRARTELAERFPPPKSVSDTGDGVFLKKLTRATRDTQSGRAVELEMVASLRVFQVTTAKHYDDYVREYRAWKESDPILGPELRIETREDLEEAALNGLLFGIFDDADRWQGYFAANEQAFYGLPSVYMFEKFLAKAVRGRGFASSIEALVLDFLAERFDTLWGNIHLKNERSIRSALRQGRVQVESSYFVGL